MSTVTLPKLNPSRSQGALGSTGRSMAASQSTTQSFGRVATAPNLKLSGSLLNFWGEGPKNAGSTKWRRDRRLEKQCDVFEADSNPATPFRRLYDRGDLPITIKHGAVKTVEWKVKPEDLDFSYFLPIFIEGLREKTEPYEFISLMGSRGMIQSGLQTVDAAGTKAAKLLPVVPQLILPMKRAFFTRDPATIVKALEALQLLVRDPKTGVGEALVPYYRQLLPVLNIYKAKKLNLGDGMDYGQAKRDFRNIGELIEETLNLLEISGGPDAFINIKYMIPTYESCMTGSRR
jgi:hypothetical protein